MTDTVAWTQQAEHLWTGKTESGHGYVAALVGVPGEFPWMVYRTTASPLRGRTRGSEDGTGSALRVTHRGWAFEFAELWERTGIRPTPDALPEIMRRLESQPA